MRSIFALLFVLSVCASCDDSAVDLGVPLASGQILLAIDARNSIALLLTEQDQAPDLISVLALETGAISLIHEGGHLSTMFSPKGPGVGIWDVSGQWPRFFLWKPGMTRAVYVSERSYALWTPDGSTIVFYEYGGSPFSFSFVRVAECDETSCVKHPLNELAENENAHMASATPNSVFYSTLEGTFVVGLADGFVTRLTASTSPSAISRDGTKAAWIDTETRSLRVYDVVTHTTADWASDLDVSSLRAIELASNTLVITRTDVFCGPGSSICTEAGCTPTIDGGVFALRNADGEAVALSAYVSCPDQPRGVILSDFAGTTTVPITGENASFNKSLSRILLIGEDERYSFFALAPGFTEAPVLLGTLRSWDKVSVGFVGDAHIFFDYQLDAFTRWDGTSYTVIQELGGNRYSTTSAVSEMPPALYFEVEGALYSRSLE